MLSDFLSATFSLEHGFVYTIYVLFRYPGRSVRLFIQGRRSRMMNPMKFLVISITLYTLVMWLGQVVQPGDTFELFRESGADEKTSQVMTTYISIVKDYMNILLFSTVPILALISYLLSFRGYLNYAENLVAAAYYSGLYNFLSVITVIPYGSTSLSFITVVLGVISVLSFLYLIYAYFRFYTGSWGLRFIKSILTQIGMYAIVLLLALGFVMWLMKVTPVDG